MKPRHNLLIFETYNLILGYYGCYCQLDVIVGGWVVGGGRRAGRGQVVGRSRAGREQVAGRSRAGRGQVAGGSQVGRGMGWGGRWASGDGRKGSGVGWMGSDGAQMWVG